ncbi:MAG: PKD domain-containing protein [Bacteroidales bacterium]
MKLACPTTLLNYRIKILFLISLLFLAGISARSQNCTNADFSLLNFEYWQAYTGMHSGSMNGCCPNTGVVPGRHTIISQTTVDTNTCGNLTVPPPGFDACARIGNANDGSEAERLVYSFTVDPANPVMIFHYAVVLEIFLDTKPNASYFTYKIVDDSNTIVDPNCGFYEAWGESGMSGYQQCFTQFHAVTWKDWTTVAVDLSAYSGQHLRLIFSAGDCPDGNHFGYGYVVAECASMELDVSLCPGSNDVVITAPAGFSYLWNTGDTAQSITIANPPFGMLYECWVSSIPGCSFHLTSFVMNTIITPDFTYSFDSCSRTAAFTSTSSITTGNDYLSLWDFGDGGNSDLRDPVHTFPGPGTYNVTLTVSTVGGCDSSVTIPITIGIVPVAQFTANDTCQGLEVFINNTSFAPDSIVQWTWKFGDNSSINTVDWNPVHIYQEPGTYVIFLFVVSSRGCIDTVSRVVTIYPEPRADFSLKSPICSGKTTTLFFTGRSTPLSVFNWDFDGGTVLSGSGAGPYSINWANSGTYNISLEIVDSMCNSVTDTTITIIVSLTPVASAGNDTTICLGHSITLSGSGGTNYLWAPATGLNNPNIFNPTAHPSVTTTYHLTVSDNSCTSTDEVIVTVEELSPITVTNDTLLCHNGAVQLNASGGTTYAWAPPTGLNATNIPNPVASPSASTIYTVTITDNTGCMAIEQVSLQLAGAINSSFSISKDSICAGQTINVFFNGGTVNPFATYTWDFAGGIVTFGSGLGPFSVTWSTGGNYTISLTVSEGTCDTVVTYKTIKVRMSPNADAGPNDTICQGESVQLNASGGISYAWWPAGTLSSVTAPNPIASPLVTTQYGVYIYNDGCLGLDSVTVWVWPLPAINLTNDTTICNGDSITLSASGGGIYTWSPPVGLSSSSVGNPIASPSITTVYTVSVTSIHGCNNSDSVTVTVNEKPISSFTVSDSTLCLGEDASLTFTGTGTPTSSYNWDFNGATIVSGSGPGPYLINWGTPGNYTVSLSVNESGCYSLTTNANIDVFKVNAGILNYQDVQCYGDSNGMATVTTSGGTSPYTFLWNILQTDSTITNLTGGEYSVTVTDVNGCTGSDTIFISAPLAPLSSLTTFENITCEYLCDGWITADPDGGTSPYYYQWSSAPPAPDSALKDLCPGLYVLTITDDHGCTLTESFNLIFNTAIHADFITDLITGFVPLTINFSFTGTGANTLNWDFGDNSTSIETNPSHIFLSPGIFEVKLIINSLDPDFCSDTALLTITAEDTSFVDVPNVFTPNNDGYNDFFTIESHFLESWSITIFNRWGRVVYSINNGNIYWNGKNNDGSELPEGTYFFTLDAKGKDGRDYSKQGSVTLLR